MLDVGHPHEDDSLVGGEPKRTCLQRFKYPLIALVILVVAVLIVAAVVLSARLGNDKSLEDLMETNNIMGHLQQLQNIANNNNGTRAAGTTGYNASVAYVVDTLQKHGYEPQVQLFPIETLTVHSITNMTAEIDGIFFNLVVGTDFMVFGVFGGTFDIIRAPTVLAGEWGCNATDYPSTPIPDSVILIKRGVCDFATKVSQAEKVNPLAVIIFNEGNTADRLGVFSGGLGSTNVPVFSTSYFTGVSLTKFPNSFVSINLTTEAVTTYTMNVIAQTKSGRADRVVLVGSHLDSVPAGPGINDNGSGSAFNLELAIQLAAEEQQKKLKNMVRFCWWGAEEIGLVGSTWYVSQLNATNQTALYEIALNLNFDMIGSPNFFRGIYNGTDDLKQGNGSAVIQRLFDNYYSEQNIFTEPTEFSGRSDYGPFLEVGIPAGGLFTGAEVAKTMNQRSQYGGLAGASYDPCYHQACDNIDNIDQAVLGDMAKGGASVLETLATQEDLATYLTVL